MKKYILIFALLISCFCASARTSWTVLGGAGIGDIGDDDAEFMVSVEASISKNDYTNWAFLPSVNILCGMLDQSAALYGGFLAGYKKVIGYNKGFLVPKFGVACGYADMGGTILGPSVGVNYEKGHFAMQLNAFFSVTTAEYESDWIGDQVIGYSDYNPFAFSFSVGYKF